MSSLQRGDILSSKLVMCTLLPREGEKAVLTINVSFIPLFRPSSAHPSYFHVCQKYSFYQRSTTMAPARPKDGLFAEHTSEVSPEPSSTDTEAVLKKAYRKADIRLLLWYSVVYTILKTESHNIANARIMNIEAGTDIKHQLGDLTSEQWAMTQSLYHYPFILFEPLSALLMKRFTPRKWMSRIILTWGIISMCRASTQNFGGIAACQFFLGVAEAGFLPGVLYHLSFWYPAARLPLRIAFLYGFSHLSGAITGLLAFGISYLNGKGGLAGWRYLFLIEGAPSVLCGTVSFFILPDYPKEARFLTEVERTKVLDNLPETQPSSDDTTWNWQQVKGVFLDATTYTFLLIWICHDIGAKGVTTVLPNVIYQLGLTGTAPTQLMTMPPYIIGAVGLMLVAWLIRRNKLKPWVAAISLELFACICFIVLITVRHPIIKYIFIILAMVSSMGIYPILWPERIRITYGTTSAALSIGITGAAAEMHGVVGPQVYQDKFGPTYRVSFIVSIGLSSVAIVGMAVTWIIIRRRDKSVVAVKEQELERAESAETSDAEVKSQKDVANA